jgi:hypothetical protein
MDLPAGERKLRDPKIFFQNWQLLRVNLFWIPVFALGLAGRLVWVDPTRLGPSEQIKGCEEDGFLSDISLPSFIS